MSDAYDKAEMWSHLKAGDMEEMRAMPASFTRTSTSMASGSGGGGADLSGSPPCLATSASGSPALGQHMYVKARVDEDDCLLAHAAELLPMRLLHVAAEADGCTAQEAECPHSQSWY